MLDTEDFTPMYLFQTKFEPWILLKCKQNTYTQNIMLDQELEDLSILKPRKFLKIAEFWTPDVWSERVL